MAENYLPQSVGLVRSLGQLRRTMGRGPLYEFLKDFASADRVYQRFDFNELKAIGDYPFAVANSGGASAASFAVKAATENGVIEADTGTTDDGSVSIIGGNGIALYGDRNAGILFRARVDDPTAYNLELGLIDAVPGSNASGVSDVDTPAAAFSDGALLTIDTDQTDKDVWFVTDGATANFDVAATQIAAQTEIAAATYFWFGIQLISNAAYAFFGATPNSLKLVASHNADADGNLEGGTALYPWAYCRTRSTTAVFPQIDLIEIWSDRN